MKRYRLFILKSALGLILAFSLCILNSKICFSQESEKKVENNSEAALNTENEESADKSPQKKRNGPSFTPVGAPAYSPELSLWFALGGLFSFSANPSEEDVPRSTIPAIFGISINKSILFNSSTYTYLNHDKIRFYNEIMINHMKDHYWGVGFDAARYTPKGDNTTRFKKTSWKVSSSFLGRVVDNLYAGFNCDFNQTKAKEINPAMAVDAYFVALGPNNLNIGLGPVLQYDSRDLPVNAYKGFYINAQMTFYASYYGGSNTYTIYDLEYRHYLSLGSTKRILAWAFRNRHGTGTIPWAELSQLGSPYDLRGYYWGRYRDRTMLYAMMEYRHRFGAKTLNRFGKKESRHGFVAWVGTGTVGNGYKDFGSWLPNGGVGYRFELQSRLNARFDVGFGLGAVAFYVKFLDAF